MAYVVQIEEVLHPFTVVNPGVAVWGHCLIEGEEDGFSCGVTFETAGPLAKPEAPLEIRFFFEVLPFGGEGRRVTFHSGPKAVFTGVLHRR